MQTMEEAYRANLIQLLDLELKGEGESQKADMLREEMAEQWYHLTPEERNRMDLLGAGASL